MTPTWWGVVRYAGSIIFATAVAVQQQYPQYHWVAIVVTVLGVLGYHAVPTSQQLLPPQPMMAHLSELVAALDRIFPPKPNAELPGGSFPIHSTMSDTAQ